MSHRIYRVEHFEIVGPYTLALRFDDDTEQRINLRPVLEGEVGSVPDLYGPRDWTKGPEFSSLRVPRRHSWAKTPGISSVIMSVPTNSI